MPTNPENTPQNGAPPATTPSTAAKPTASSTNGSSTNGSSTVGGALAFRMFGVFALAYALSYAFRTVNAVIAQPLAQDLHLTASQLGLLASAYFVSFAAMQLPVGLLLDKFEPRKVEAGLLCLAALGAAVFSQAQGFVALWLGRACIGIGVSACLMAALKTYSLYYKPELQASLSAWMLMAGSAGALLATVPVELAMAHLGWRGVFAMAAGLCLVAAVALRWALPSLPRPGTAESNNTPNSTLNNAPRSAPGSALNSSLNSALLPGLKTVFAHPQFWRLAPLCFMVQGGFMAFQGLWMGPWLTEVQGLSNAAAAQWLLLLAGTLMLCYLGLGFATRHMAQRGLDERVLMCIGMGLSTLVLAYQVWQGPQASLALWMLQAALVACGIITYNTCNQLFDKSLHGRSSTALNLMIFSGAFAVQWGLGVGIDLGQSQGLAQAQAMQAALSTLCALQLASWLWYAAAFASRTKTKV